MEIIEEIKIEKHGTGDRFFALGFAGMAYMVGSGSLFWLIFAAGGFVPLGFVDVTHGNGVLALAVNAILVILFGVQHSVMARRWFKDWLTRFIPAHLERANFVLVSGLLTLVVIVMWQPIDAQVWYVENVLAAIGLQVAYWFGIAYLLSSSFVTNHFELFGLRQAWLYFTNVAYTPLAFKQRFMYRYSRHPMMLGLLLVFWCSPEMTVTRFTLALLFTVYIFEGIRHEESGLIDEFGDKYRQYRKEIGLFFTLK